MVSRVLQNSAELFNISNRVIAFAAMILVSIALSSSGLIIRNIEAATPWQINIYRNFSFFIVVSAIFFLRYRSKSITELKRVKPPVVWAAISLAITGIALVQSFTHTLIANTVFIMSLVPFIASVLAYFLLKEAVSKILMTTILISVAGLFAMIAEGIGTGSNYGNIMALLAAFGFASFAVIARAHRNLEMLPALMLASIIIVVTSIAFSIDDISVSAHDLYLCILWGAGISGMAHWIFVLAARYMAAAELTLFGLLESSLAPIWVWMFISETPGFWTLFGGFAIIMSVGFVSLAEMQKAKSGRTTTNQ